MGRPDTRTLGSDAETLALGRLKAHGLCLVARNSHCRLGEIDLVMTDGDCLVFVEVRYRRRGNPVTAAQSIGPQKQRRLTLAASRFIARNRRFHDRTVRFDVIAIDGVPGAGGELNWIRDAFRPAG